MTRAFTARELGLSRAEVERLTGRRPNPYKASGHLYEHRVVAERILGRPLPIGAEVHHVNGDERDNRPGNLVICPDRAYHALLHQRQRALEACGNANWLLCAYCQRYDAPDRLYRKPSSNDARHRQCHADYEAIRKRGAFKPWHPFRSKWEHDFNQHLTILKGAGLIVDFSYEIDRLVIGIGATYKPDFKVIMPDGSVEYIEVKGYRREAGMVRVKAAALRYPQFRFILVTKSRGQWTHTVIGAVKGK